MTTSARHRTNTIVSKILGELDAKAQACEDTAKAWASVESHQRASDYREQAEIFQWLAAQLRRRSAGNGQRVGP
jgi:hypothetical protein